VRGSAWMVACVRLGCSPVSTAGSAVAACVFGHSETQVPARQRLFLMLWLVRKKRSVGGGEGGVGSFAVRVPLVGFLISFQMISLTEARMTMGQRCLHMAWE